MKTLQQFLTEWDSKYISQQSTVGLFNQNVSDKLSLSEQQRFALLFYHIRGHFDRFLWLVASLAETLDQKQKVIANMTEEFGAEKEGQKSHEQLYYDFCECLDVDILSEVRDEKYNLPFIQDFNRGHQQFLVDSSPIARWAAFLVYERLDNEYKVLLQLIDGWGVPKKGRVFFFVHSQVTHFEAASTDLEALWEKDSEEVIEGFNFIAQHQLNVWAKLSSELGI